jgi:hypothetical protein
MLDEVVMNLKCYKSVILLHAPLNESLIFSEARVGLNSLCGVSNPQIRTDIEMNCGNGHIQPACQAHKPV